MAKTYLHTKTTVSFIRYHLVFCPRYRRKIFDIEGIEERFKTLTRNVCEQNGIDIIAMECARDHVHMLVSVLPQMSIPSMVKCIKGATSVTLRKEFPVLSKMPSLWTRSYFISTEGTVTSDVIKKYVLSQKTRYY